MDRTTYSDPDVVRTVNEEFVPVRVDIDMRPDISERYNRGGFPTTAFLSEKGVSIWGATYVPPPDLKRVMEAILRAKRSGEIDRALQGAKAIGARAPGGRRTTVLPSSDELERVFSGLMDAYDPDHGGFGLEPKFPHPDAVDLLISRYLSKDDPNVAGAVRMTLTRMGDGLHDEVEGGVFRYSVTRDWSVPHFEKMLETNLGYLRNLSRAHVALGDGRFKALADGIARYLLGALRDPSTGAFYGSQDADEEYYALSAERRSMVKPPAIDRTVYSGWNALASATLMEAGVMLGRKDLMDAGLAALDHMMTVLWNPEKGLVRHSEGQDLYLAEDQVELLGALLAGMELTGVKRLEQPASRLVESTRAAFGHPDGGLGDIASDASGSGALSHPIRSLVTSSKWALRLCLLGVATSRDDLCQEARAILGSFDIETVRAHGMFSAPYLTAIEVVNAGPTRVEVHGPGRSPYENALWRASKRALEPAVFTEFMNGDETFAVACSGGVCSRKLTVAEELVQAIRSRHGQVKSKYRPGA